MLGKYNKVWARKKGWHHNELYTRKLSTYKLELPLKKECPDCQIFRLFKRSQKLRFLYISQFLYVGNYFKRFTTMDRPKLLSQIKHIWRQKKRNLSCRLPVFNLYSTVIRLIFKNCLLKHLFMCSHTSGGSNWDYFQTSWVTWKLHFLLP